LLFPPRIESLPLPPDIRDAKFKFVVTISTFSGLGLMKEYLD
jgi:hypothetical protein